MNEVNCGSNDGFNLITTQSNIHMVEIEEKHVGESHENLRYESIKCSKVLLYTHFELFIYFK